MSSHELFCLYACTPVSPCISLYRPHGSPCHGHASHASLDQFRPDPLGCTDKRSRDLPIIEPESAEEEAMDQGQVGAQGPDTRHSGRFVEERDPLEEARCQGPRFSSILAEHGDDLISTRVHIEFASTFRPLAPLRGTQIGPTTQ